VIAHCAFDLYSIMISDIEHLFMRLLAICMSLENVYSGLCLFFNQVVFVGGGGVLSGLRSLYVFCILISYWILFANISHFVVFFFHFSDFSFAMQKLFSFDVIPFVYFYFCFPCLSRHI